MSSLPFLLRDRWHLSGSAEAGSPAAPMVPAISSLITMLCKSNLHSLFERQRERARVRMSTLVSTGSLSKCLTPTWQDGASSPWQVGGPITTVFRSLHLAANWHPELGQELNRGSAALVSLGDISR